MILRNINFILILFAGIFSNLHAQQSLIYNSDFAPFKKGMELLEKEKYSAAQHVFEEALETVPAEMIHLRSDIQFYHAICAVRLYHSNAEYLITKFIEQNPGSPNIKDAYLEMGRSKYDKEKWAEAIHWFSKTDKYYLSQDEYGELYFKMGYSYFKINNYTEARVALYEIININTTYTPPALYYYSHIAYEQGNFETALNGFRKLVNDETFSPVVPYYITQILYAQQKYDEILSFAPPLFTNITSKRKAEFARVIADSYYMKHLYDSSLSYYQLYLDSTDKPSENDIYRVAYVYYRLKNYEKASSLFETITSDTSNLSQNALYHLGDCYLQLNDKQKARLAFSSAASYSNDSIIQRDARFNYAMLTYELSLNPFNDAIEAFHDYIEKYPRSEKVDIAFKFLVMAYLNTKNYQGALESIDRIKNKTPDIYEALQRIAYFRALELFNNLDFSNALIMLNQSLANASYDHILKAKATYWRAETYYRLEKYDEAINDYKTFIQSLGAYQLETYNVAHYGIGYSFFKQKKYPDASSWFRKYVNFEKKCTNNKVNDAYNRIGDCYFMATDYHSAIEYYDKAIQCNKIDADYAYFQKGFSLGLNGKHVEKITALKKLLKNYPSTEFYDDAVFEIANSFIETEQPDSAINRYQEIVNRFTQSSYVSKSLVQLGLIHFNRDKNQEAMAYFKRVIEQFPGTEEEKNALNGLKNIYVVENKLDDYIDYVKKEKNYSDISQEQKDSLKFAGAQNVYMQGKCDEATGLFTSYINEFSKGSFLLHAHYYLGDCYQRKGEKEKALAEYKYIIDATKNTFTDEALLASGTLYMEQQKFSNALEMFSKLETSSESSSVANEAILNQLRCLFELKQNQKYIALAPKYLDDEKNPVEKKREVRFNLAKSYYNLGEWEDASNHFSLVAMEVKSMEGAESKYMVAKLLFRKSRWDEVKKEVFDFIDMNTPHRYWLAKAFLLLADAYTATGDNFQALHTVKSVVDNYDNQEDGIIDEANKKMLELMDK